MNDESTLLLTQRVRLGLWLVLFGAALFSVSDLRFERSVTLQLWAIKLAHVPFVVGSFIALRRRPTRAVAMSVALLQVALICLFTALSGYVAQEQVTGPIMIVFVAFVAALIVPWGARFQMLAAASAALSLILHQFLLNGGTALILGHDGIAIAAALAVSVLVAWNFEGQRQAQAERDVERRQAAAALAVAEENKSAVLAAALDAIISVDREGRVIELNPAAERMFGYTRAAALGRDIGELVVPAAARGSHNSGFARVLATGQSGLIGRRVELSALRADGSEFPAELALTRIGEGERLTFTAYIRDLTEQRRAEREQRRLAEILEATTDLVGTTDPSGKVLYYNAAGREMIGIADGEDLGAMRSADNIPPRSWQRVVDGCTYAASEGRAWRGEAEITTRDGRVVPVSQVIVAHKDADGRVQAFSTIARDISEQKRAEEALQEDAFVSRAMAHFGQEVMAALDSPGLNRRLCELTAETLGSDASHTFLWSDERSAFVPFAGFGESSEEWEGLRVLALPRNAAPGVLARLESEDAVQLALQALDGPAAGYAEIPPREAGASDRLRSVAAQSGFSRGVYIALRKGGKLIGFQDASYRLRDEPIPRAQMRIARAIGQMASLVIEHAQLIEALERANRLKSEFVATMSHELRTPLNVIMGYNALLRDGDYGPINDEQREVMARVDRSSQELLELINATLDMSRLDAGRVPLDVREIGAADLLSELDLETRPTKLKPGVVLRWETTGELPRLRTDPGKVKVVLKNLIGNAAKFTDRGSITVSAGASDGVVEFRVSDTGIGIPASSLPIIFEAFRQVDGSSTRRHGGVGLGLYIVKRLVDVLGGAVEVQSEEGRGSTFLVRLPLDSDHGDRAALHHEHGVAAYQSPSRATGT